MNSADLNIPFLLLLAFYIIAATIIAVYARRGVVDQEDYFVGGRKIGGIVSALTYAVTTYSAFMIVGLVGFAYSTGVGSAGFELVYLVATLFLLSYYGPRIWKMGKEKGLITPSEIYKKMYGPVVTRLSVLVALVALVPYISAQVTGISLILEKNIHISFELGVIFITFLIAIWAVLGGLRGVAWTDAVQGLIILVSTVLAVSWIYLWGFGSSGSIVESLQGTEVLKFPNSFWTPLQFFAMALPWSFFSLTNPQVFQRMFIPRDVLSLRKMILLFAIFGLMYTVLTTFMGLELRALTENGVFPAIDYRDDVTPTAIQFMPQWLSLLISLSIIAAAVTTSNSIILTLSSMTSRDIARKRSVLAGEITIVILTITAALFALQRPDYIVELSVLSSTILLCQLPLILGVFHSRDRKRKRITGMATLLAGFTVAVASIFDLTLPHLPVSIWVFMISFAVYILVSRLESAVIS
ncbi:MAG: sodium:solute symporter [Archaeoglobaceae archaeon]